MEELRQMEKEYSSGDFFTRFTLIAINDTDISQNKSYIEVRTLESLDFNVHVTVDGWYAIRSDSGSKSMSYPTFEALARTISPQFSTNWNRTLFQRLQEHQDSDSECSSLGAGSMA